MEAQMETHQPQQSDVGSGTGNSFQELLTITRLDLCDAETLVLLQRIMRSSRCTPDSLMDLLVKLKNSKIASGLPLRVGGLGNDVGKALGSLSDQPRSPGTEIALALQQAEERAERFMAESSRWRARAIHLEEHVAALRRENMAVSDSANRSASEALHRDEEARSRHRQLRLVENDLAKLQQRCDGLSKTVYQLRRDNEALVESASRFREEAQANRDSNRRLRRTRKLVEKLNHDLHCAESERDALRERCARIPLEMTAQNELWLGQMERLQCIREEARRKAEARCHAQEEELRAKDRELNRVADCIAKLALAPVT